MLLLCWHHTAGDALDIICHIRGDATITRLMVLLLCFAIIPLVMLLLFLEQDDAARGGADDVHDWASFLFRLPYGHG